MKPYRSSNGKQQEMSAEEREQILQVIRENRFRYAYQPIVRAATGEIYGYEALMRAGEKGELSPMKVLDCAYDAGCLYEIEKSTFFNVFAQVRKQEADFAGKKLFINSIPGYMLQEEDYRKWRDDYHDLFKDCMVEITEALEMEDEDLEAMKKRSREDGFQIAIDDYGTGYSNTTNLLRHLPSCVKIDRLLISRIHEEKRKRHFVKSMIDFAHDNGFMTLAEGVETLPELRCVIELGVDLIQGYYTARPSFEILQEIDAGIQSEIRNANVRGQTATSQNVYVVTDEEELPLLRVALEQNTGLLIGREKFKLVGNPDYIAIMGIKIKDGMACTLTLRDVWVESLQDLPCIELGQNVDLTIILEGVNHLERTGIYVPESSTLRILGKGDLEIEAKGTYCYAIGNQWESPVGTIIWDAEGECRISIKADNAIGIGGGYSSGEEGICLKNGRIHLMSASGKSISIGTVKGGTPVTVQNCELILQSGVEHGVEIGSFEGEQDIRIRNAKISSDSSGNGLTFIGCAGEGSGTVSLEQSTIRARYSGYHINLMGCETGDIRLLFTESKLRIHGEGAQVMGFGTRNMRGELVSIRSDLDVEIQSGGHMMYGMPPDQIVIEGGIQNISEKG